MTTKSHPDESEPTPDSTVTTRADLKAETKAEPVETVKVKGPGGTKVTTSEETAEALKAAGYE